MTRNDDRRAADLDQYWDALAAGRPEAAPTPADGELTALVDRLHRAITLPTLFPTPDAAWREIRPATARSRPGALEAGAGAPISFESNGRVAAFPARPATAPPARGRVTVQAAAAMLLVLAIAAGYLAFWQARQNRLENQTWLPASVAATLSDDYSEETLFRATFAADERPVGLTEGILYRLTMPPGTTLPLLTGMACDCPERAPESGIGIEIVQSGAYRVRIDAPVWIQRGGFAAERQEIPAGQAVTLEPGDIAIYHDYAASAEAGAVGGTPVVIVGFAILDWGASQSPGDSGHLLGLPPEVRGEVLANAIPADWEEFPGGPISVTLRRVTLPPGTVLPPFEPAALEGIRIESGGIGWGFVREGEAQPRGPLIDRRDGATAPFTYAPPGVQRFLKTTGDEPAVLLVLTVEPSGQWANVFG